GPAAECRPRSSASAPSKAPPPPRTSTRGSERGAWRTRPAASRSRPWIPERGLPAFPNKPKINHKKKKKEQKLKTLEEREEQRRAIAERRGGGMVFKYVWNRWTSFAAGLLMMMVSGTPYLFSQYGPTVKDEL